MAPSGCFAHCEQCPFALPGEGLYTDQADNTVPTMQAAMYMSIVANSLALLLCSQRDYKVGQIQCAEQSAFPCRAPALPSFAVACRYNQPRSMRCSSTERAVYRDTIKPCYCWRGCSTLSRTRQTLRTLPNVSAFPCSLSWVVGVTSLPHALSSAGKLCIERRLSALLSGVYA